MCPCACGSPPNRHTALFAARTPRLPALDPPNWEVPCVAPGNGRTWMQHPPVCPDVLPQKAMTGQFCEAAPVQCTVHSEDATPKPKKSNSSAPRWVGRSKHTNPCMVPAVRGRTAPKGARYNSLVKFSDLCDRLPHPFPFLKQCLVQSPLGHTYSEIREVVTLRAGVTDIYSIFGGAFT